MRQLPRTLAEAVTTGTAAEPLALLVCWAERGPEYRLIAPSQLAGSGDPAAANDANVQVVDGALILASGNAVAMDPAATTAAGAMTTSWAGSVTEVGQWVWA